MAISSVAKFLIVAFGISWSLEIASILATGTANTEIAGIAIYGPALAGLLLSRTPGFRSNSRTVSPRAIWLPFFWIFCAATIFLHTPTPIRAEHPWLVLVVASSGSFIPAWILSGAFSRNEGVRGYLRTLVVPRSVLWSVLPPVSFALFLLVPIPFAHLLRGNVSYPTLPYDGMQRAGFIALNFMFMLIAGGGVSEEPGWRGYLLPQLQKQLSPLTASLAVWLVWAFWHLPMDLTGAVGASVSSYLGNRLVQLMPLSVLATWFYNRSKGSILSPALFHASFNSFPLFLPTVSRTDWLLWVWAVAVIVLDRMWRRDPRTIHATANGSESPLGSSSQPRLG